MNSSEDDQELNNPAETVNGHDEEVPVGIDAMENPTPIAKFGSMAEAGFFVQELEFHLGIPAAIFEDQEFNAMMGAFTNFAQILVPKTHAEDAVEFLKNVFHKDEEDAEALEELFGKEKPVSDNNPYASDDDAQIETHSSKGLLILLLATAGLILGLMLNQQ